MACLNPKILGTPTITRTGEVRKISIAGIVESLNTFRINVGLLRRTMIARHKQMLIQMIQVMLLFVLWRTRQNHGC